MSGISSIVVAGVGGLSGGLGTGGLGGGGLLSGVEDSDSLLVIRSGSENKLFG
jgi:hypothetical protein